MKAPAQERRVAQGLPLLLLALLLVGPAPGEVGGCGADPFVVEAEDFCRDQAAWECRRAEARGELEGESLSACFDTIPNSCVGAGWPPSCVPRPTSLQTNACLDALALEENVRVPIEELDACVDVCPAAPAGGAP
ncbi:MAG: hypothetical protein H6725_06770 [Sandaracinaceae bacterium]|nr:hypothetical protein [Sandaracinaceae bacterium]